MNPYVDEYGQPYTEVYQQGIALDLRMVWLVLRNPAVKNKLVFWRLKRLFSEVVQQLKERNFSYFYRYEAFFADPGIVTKGRQRGLGMTKRGAHRRLLRGTRRRGR